MGGEESGGIGTKLHLPERDATVSALLLAEVMAWHGKRLGELVAHAAPRIRRAPLRPRGPNAARTDRRKKRSRIFREPEIRKASRLADRSPRGSRRRQSLSRRNRVGDGARIGDRADAARLFRNDSRRKRRAACSRKWRSWFETSWSEKLPLRLQLRSFSGCAVSVRGFYTRRRECRSEKRAASAEENFFASSSASSITTFGGAVPGAKFVDGQPQNAPVDGREPLEPPVSASFSTADRSPRPAATAPSNNWFANFASRFRRRAPISRKALSTRAGFLARHVPFEKHLQREFAGFVAKRHQRSRRRSRMSRLGRRRRSSKACARSCAISTAPSPTS